LRVRGIEKLRPDVSKTIVELETKEYTVVTKLNNTLQITIKYIA